MPVHSRLTSFVVACLAYLAIGATAETWGQRAMPYPHSCSFWVAPAPEGDDANPGSSDQPWATLEHAAATVPDDTCTVWFERGTYGAGEVERRFTTPTTFRAVAPYRAVFVSDGAVVKLDGARNVRFEGFRFRHSGPGSGKHVVIMDRRGELWSEDVVFYNNIFHDSYNNDLLKIHNGSRFVTVENNVFYNQGDSDQHIDVNSVTDVVIRDNIFFNDFAGSGRNVSDETKHFIVVKDSNEGSDGLIGSRRIAIRRNIFLNWQGGAETLVKMGNDGKPYHEAQDVQIENNLVIGNSPHLIAAAFAVRGARNITFANNSVVGDLPAKAYAFRITIRDQNPVNEDITFVNNVWSDPTGTMGVDLEGGDGEFSDGDPAETNNLILDNNLYWNGGSAIPGGEIASPLVDDARRVVANPLIPSDQESVILPRWTGWAFASGNQSIRQEFVRLVEQYGRLAAGSPAIGGADPALAPPDDILGRSRSATPDLGAYEYRISLGGTSTLNSIVLYWSPPHEAGATSLTITFSSSTGTQQITGIPITANSYVLTDLLPYSFYDVVLTVRAEDDRVLAESDQIRFLTTDQHFFLPLASRLFGIATWH